MNNSQFDNKVSNAFVNVIGTIIRTVERSIVVFWDGLRIATVHGTPSLVGFFAAISPLVAPMAMAAMTALNLKAHFGWADWQAWVMALSLEIVGFPLWVFTTEAVFIDGWKGTSRQMWLVSSVFIYEAVIIVVNVFLSGKTAVDFFLYLFLCMLPALCGIAYSYSNRENKAKLEQERQEMIDANIRAEQNALKLDKYKVKHGSPQMAPVMADTVQVEVKEPKTKHASDMKDKIRSRLDAKWKASQTVWGAADLCKEVGLDPATERSEVWRQIQAWKKENGVS